MDKKKAVKKRGKNTMTTSEKIDKELKETVQLGSPELDPKDLDMVTEKLKEILGSDKTPAEVIGVNEELIDQYYQFAYDNYNAGKFDDAKLLFQFLISLQPEEGKNWLGLAAAYQQLGEYKLAIERYLALSFMEPENPLPHYYCSDCFMKLDDPMSSAMMLGEVVKRCGENNELETLKTRAQASLEKIITDQGFKLRNKAKKEG